MSPADGVHSSIVRYGIGRSLLTAVLTCRCSSRRDNHGFPRVRMRERTLIEKEGGTMVTREEIREQMLERKDEWLARKDQLKERFGASGAQASP